MITTTHIRRELNIVRQMLLLFERKVEKGLITADHPQIAIYKDEVEGLEKLIEAREGRIVSEPR